MRVLQFHVMLHVSFFNSIYVGTIFFFNIIFISFLRLYIYRRVLTGHNLYRYCKVEELTNIPARYAVYTTKVQKKFYKHTSCSFALVGVRDDYDIRVKYTCVNPFFLF